MNPASLLNSYVIDERFERSLKRIRSALESMELDVVGEVDISERPHSRSVVTRSKILLVDCPPLDIEALLRHRAAAVFLPVHVLVTAAGEATEVSVVNPSGLLGTRLPAESAGPLDRLVSRVVIALESVAQEMTAVHF